MPLPAPTVERSLMHSRKIVCDGYERADGLYEIDGWLTDTKGYPFETPFRGTLPIGEPQHSLGLRIVIDKDFVIRDVIALMDSAPTHFCRGALPNFSKLIGLKFAGGFNRAAREVIGGTDGCTHLLDLLGPMGTTATQTVWSKRFHETAKGEAGKRPAIVGTCHGWSEDGPMVQAAFPAFYTGDPNAKFTG